MRETFGRGAEQRRERPPVLGLESPLAAVRRERDRRVVKRWHGVTVDTEV